MSKVLIIEDDMAIARALKEKFELEGFSVIQAEDGNKGVDLAKHQRPDLLLLDLILPGLDGLAVLENLMSNSETKSIPVIVLTNVSNEKVEAETKRLGAKMFLVKTDWKLDEVIEKAKSVL